MAKVIALELFLLQEMLTIQLSKPAESSRQERREEGHQSKSTCEGRLEGRRQKEASGRIRHDAAYENYQRGYQ